MHIIIGLGNPGKEYARTRHNVGYMAVDTLSERLGIPLDRRGFRSLYGEGRLGGERVILAKPETFMNASGFAAVDLVNWYKPFHDEITVIYDDIDLPCGALRIRKNGSAGTHNGMRSLTEQLGFEDYPRIRIGIGKPLHGLIDHVLGAPDGDDAKAIDEAVRTAAEAAEMIIRGQIDEAQTKFNYKPEKKPKQRGEASSKKADPAFSYAPKTEFSSLASADEVFFQNTEKLPAKEALSSLPYSLDDVLDAQARLERFRPLIAALFPETEAAGGLIESELHFAKKLTSALEARVAHRAFGDVYLKLDSHLPISGSVKARGGIYEVLKHTEALALENGIITPESDYSVLKDCREFFSGYTVQVGSTGNLGLGIGISASAIGFKTVVHMSADAKQWKKDLLRSRGARVVEYEGDYSSAVKRGRELSSDDEKSYFIDDENSLDLFMGYAVAALRLKKQFDERGIIIDKNRPLYAYLPCGVGGAPGGILFGLKLVFGDAAHCFYVEPVNAPCMLAAFIGGRCVPVTEFGLSGMTEADGLAVGTASELVYGATRHLSDGEFTVADDRLLPLVRLINNTEGIFVEPSAAISLAALEGMLRTDEESGATITQNAVHLLWFTGGSLVPPEEREVYLGRAKRE